MNNLLKVKGKSNLIALIISILIAEGTGALSALLSGNIKQLYASLKGPSFAPPGWLFGIVWPILFLLMATAAYRIWMLREQDMDANLSLWFYAIQLILNFFWQILFTTFQLRGAALLEIIVLLILIIITTLKFYKLDKTSGYLMIPYILWVSFASVLTYSYWVLNK